MPKQNETRRYPMADADLKQEADNLRNNINRDIVQFNTRNITTTNVTVFADLIDQFNETSTDIELQGFSITAVAEKDALAEQIRSAIRPIRNMADLAYYGAGKYNVFGFDDMRLLSDNDLYRMCKRVGRIGTLLLEELMPKGLTTNQLNNLDGINQMFNSSIDNVHIANENRDLETQDRIVKGNALWAEMGDYASIGQSLFADTDEARYNDYVLTGSSAAPVITPVTPTSI